MSQREWCWNWNSSTLATSCEELNRWKRLWCWEGLRAGGEGDDRGWDGWMASLTWWTWAWVNSRSWWWTGRPGVLQFMGSQESDTTERLSWTELNMSPYAFVLPPWHTIPGECPRGALHEAALTLHRHCPLWASPAWEDGSTDRQVIPGETRMRPTASPQRPRWIHSLSLFCLIPLTFAYWVRWS